MAMSPNQLQAAFTAAQNLQQAGRFAEAERAWIDLDKTAPGRAGILTNLAMVQWQMGAHDEAEAAAARAIEAGPEMVQAHAIHAAVAEARGADEEAIERYERALKLKPDLGTVLHCLSNLHRRAGDLAKAREYANRMVEATPGTAAAHDALGAILLATGDLDEADPVLSRAAKIDPKLASARANLGALFAEQRKWSTALEHLDAALAIDASMTDAHNNRGNVLISLGRPKEAEDAYIRALELSPKFADAKFNQALLWLRQGKWSEAWPGFEARWQTRQLAPFQRSFQEPMWDGTPEPDKSVLLHAEQGMGDMLMVARYLPMMTERVGRVVVECQSELRALINAMTGDFNCFTSGGGLPAFDMHLPAMSLPRVFKTTPQTIPWDGPYVAAPEDSATELPEGEGLKVGLVWAGSPLNPTNPDRSLPLASLASLLNVEGCRFFSLQQGPPGNEIVNTELGDRIVDMRPWMPNFAATATIIAKIDLVVTVCTSVAHLAGAMGKPVWILLSADADWRWLMESDDTLWYPSARLFRQLELGEWDDPVARISIALNKCVTGR